MKRRQRLEKCVYKPRIDSNIRSQEKNMEQILFQSLQREHVPADPLILNFKPAEL